MDLASVGPDGHVRLDDLDEVADWPSLSELAADYWCYQRLSGRDKEAGDMAAWTCVLDFVGEPAWEGALELIGVVLSQALDDEVGVIAAGPLEEMVAPAVQGPMFIAGIETLTRKDSRWAAAVGGVWLDRSSDPDVNRRLALFGAKFSDCAPSAALNAHRHVRSVRRLVQVVEVRKLD